MADQIKALDNYNTQMLDLTIKGINQAVATKQKEVDYWRQKAQMLASKFKVCLICGAHAESMECIRCYKERNRKENSHA